MLDELARARSEFQALVAAVRPELHRYCARLTGSIIDGEDIVQDTLARAFYALGNTTDMPPLRPWLFRIAHNAAIDHLRRVQRGPFDDLPDAEAADVPPDPEIARRALRAFVTLPVRQRSAVILKDVLGFTLEEIADMMETTVMAVKAALVRGRTALRENAEGEDTEARAGTASASVDRALLARYVELFNARDWDGLRAMLAEDVRLDLVSQHRRSGRAVGEYFSRYAARPSVRAALGTVDGHDAILLHEPADAPHPTSVVLLTWRDGRVADIRDFRYVAYLTAELAT